MSSAFPWDQYIDVILRVGERGGKSQVNLTPVCMKTWVKLSNPEQQVNVNFLLR